MHACDAAEGRKMRYYLIFGPFAPTTGTLFGKFLYTTIACNDTPFS